MNEIVMHLKSNENQARGLAEYGYRFMEVPLEAVAPEVWERLELFYLDSVACGVSAISRQANAPSVLRKEALRNYKNDKGCYCYGSDIKVSPEKAILANSSAVREWDSNGTVFGYNPARGDTKGEFGHNDFYPVALAAAQIKGLSGAQVIKGMLLSDEIRGRLAEVYSLKDKKIDHVVHGAIASAVTYGVMMGASIDEIETAIGLLCAHYVPFRAIRAGHQLSDSKGASAAFSTEMAIVSVHRAHLGFVGPKDIFRNPEALWCLFEKPEKGHSPFNLHLGLAGKDFSVMGMHFKLGLYEHQSAGAIEVLLNLLKQNPAIYKDINGIESIDVTIYQPAYGIICDPEKWHPDTRQSADHSMPYILATLLRKASERKTADWGELILLPDDYNDNAIKNIITQSIMPKIKIIHGGKEYDSKYPEGIPTSIRIKHTKAGEVKSNLIMYPFGHAKNTEADVKQLLNNKFNCLLKDAVNDVEEIKDKCTRIAHKSKQEVLDMTDFVILEGDKI